MEVQPKQATAKAPSERFTGDIWIDYLAKGESPSPLSVGAVHFTPGARTAWHSHNGGQVLYITEGRGRVQSRGSQILDVSVGDTIYTSDGEEHWHGAAPEHFMTHVTITHGEAKWSEHVTDDEYLGHVE